MSQNSKIKDEFFISIIILNYNGGNTLLDCVESVFKTVAAPRLLILPLAERGGLDPHTGWYVSGSNRTQHPS